MNLSVSELTRESYQGCCNFQCCLNIPSFLLLVLGEVIYLE
jgi:hypothetical protein